VPIKGPDTFSPTFLPLYVQSDANWNVTALIDAAGTVEERYVYDSYGAITFLTPNWSTIGSSSFSWVYLHQGGRFDSITQLYEFRARDLSPILGSWLETDPISYDSQDTNLYRYVNNDPTTSVDPQGSRPSRPPIVVFPPFPILGVRYGNFCGPFSPPGPGSPLPPPKPKPGRRPKTPADAIDDLDKCCLAHDNCYGTAGPLAAAPGIGPAMFGAQICDCDAKLCDCATKIDCKKLYPINDWLDRLHLRQCQAYRIKVKLLFCRGNSTPAKAKNM